MLVIQGYFENGVFVPDIPLAAVKGRQKATLTIEGEDEQARAWRRFGEAVLGSDEVLEGEPERLQFRNLE